MVSPKREKNRERERERSRAAQEQSKRRRRNRQRHAGLTSQCVVTVVASSPARRSNGGGDVVWCGVRSTARRRRREEASGSIYTRGSQNPRAPVRLKKKTLPFSRKNASFFFFLSKSKRRAKMTRQKLLPSSLMQCTVRCCAAVLRSADSPVKLGLFYRLTCKKKERMKYFLRPILSAGIISVHNFNRSSYLKRN